MLDPSLAEAHAALGMEKSHYEFDFPGAEKEFLKALELNPELALCALVLFQLFPHAHGPKGASHCGKQEGSGN